MFALTEDPVNPVDPVNQVDPAQSLVWYGWRLLCFITLVEFFATEQGGQEETEEPILRNPSSFCPPVNRNKELDAAINLINGLILNQPESKKSNKVKKNRKGINDLKNNDDIIIKKIDKDGSVVNKTKHIIWQWYTTS